MAATREQIESLVREHYPHGFESGLYELYGQITGYVRSEDFAKVKYEDRLREFRKLLNDRFGQHMVNVSVIRPLAPGEEP